MSRLIDISKKDKAAVLTALYNHAGPKGLAFLYYDHTPIEVSKARELLEKQGSYFDCIRGRVLRVDLSGYTIDPTLYYKANGEGAAELAISTVPDC